MRTVESPRQKLFDEFVPGPCRNVIVSLVSVNSRRHIGSQLQVRSEDSHVCFRP